MNKILALLKQKCLFIKNKAVSIYNQNFSTPVGAYVLLFFATALFLWHGLTSHCDFTKNVGYSLCASIIAALFIDIGNTHAKYNSEKKQFIMKVLIRMRENARERFTPLSKRTEAQRQSIARGRAVADSIDAQIRDRHSRADRTQGFNDFLLNDDDDFVDDGD